MEPTEDIPYEVESFATPDRETPKGADVDQPNKSVLQELSEELAHDIENNNSFNVITLPVNATPEQKIGAFDDMAIHKGLALHLEKYKLMVDNKIKELL